jgi:hypothetical protein
MTDESRPRTGAVRYWDEDQQRWVVADPGTIWFSTVTMLAT